MTDRRWKQTLLAALGCLTIFLLWPAEAQKPDPNKRTIWAYRDGDGRTIICGLAEPTDAQLEHARTLMVAGFSYPEVQKWLDRELETAPPKCLRLFGPIGAGDFPILN
jgi:hypothetical protein